MPITTLPAAPSRSDPSTFAAKGDALLGALAGFVTEANALETNVNAKQVSATAEAATATAQAAIATAANNMAQAAANYKGPWASCAGAAAVPYAVSHLGKYWQLASNLADVAAKTPGTDPEWIVISGYYARVNKTQANSPVTLVAGDCDGFKTYTNTGSGAEVQFNLPAGADGLIINAIITAAQYATFLANGTETIRYFSTTSKAGGKIKSNVIGSQLRLEWSGTQWIAIVVGSGWLLETS